MNAHLQLLETFPEKKNKKNQQDPYKSSLGSLLLKTNLRASTSIFKGKLLAISMTLSNLIGYKQSFACYLDTAFTS